MVPKVAMTAEPTVVRKVESRVAVTAEPTVVRTAREGFEAGRAERMVALKAAKRAGSQVVRGVKGPVVASKAACWAKVHEVEMPVEFQALVLMAVPSVVALTVASMVVTLVVARAGSAVASKAAATAMVRAAVKMVRLGVSLVAATVGVARAVATEVEATGVAMEAVAAMGAREETKAVMGEVAKVVERAEVMAACLVEARAGGVVPLVALVAAPVVEEVKVVKLADDTAKVVAMGAEVVMEAAWEAVAQVAGRAVAVKVAVEKGAG